MSHLPIKVLVDQVLATERLYPLSVLALERELRRLARQVKIEVELPFILNGQWLLLTIRGNDHTYNKIYRAWGVYIGPFGERMVFDPITKKEELEWHYRRLRDFRPPDLKIILSHLPELLSCWKVHLENERDQLIAVTNVISRLSDGLQQLG